MTVTPTEVISLDSVSLNNEVTKGLFPDQVLALKERVLEINDELGGIGQGVRAVAAHLYEIRQNVKPGNWKAFLKSGSINCSERFAIDMVSAHEKWLGGSDIDDHILSALTPRSLAVMGGTPKSPVTDRQRQKVFELVEAGEKVTEATVRYLVKGRNKPGKPKAEPKSVDAKGAELTARCEQYKKQVKTLQDQNRKLRKLADEAAESLIEWESKAGAKV